MKYINETKSGKTVYVPNGNKGKLIIRQRDLRKYVPLTVSVRDISKN